MAKAAESDKSDNRKPTMADVAKHVGVSRQLVGLAFREEPGVGPETAARIKAAAKQLGYRPNMAAQSLRRDSSNYIGLMFHIDHSSMQTIVPAIYKHAKAAGYNLVLSIASESHKDSEALEELLGHRCEGLILSASTLAHSRLQKLAREIPLVSLGRRLENVRGGVVSSKGEEGIFNLTRHLIDLGHSDIAYVYAKDMMDAVYRLEGYMAAMSNAKLKTRVVTVEGDFGEQGGAHAAEHLLKEHLPTAIVCNNDQAAFGLTHRLQMAGLKIPDDISVTGFDDTVAQFDFLSLTTARQDPDEIAKAVIDDLVARIKGEKHLADIHLTSANLVIRTSTSKPRQNRELKL